MSAPHPTGPSQPRATGPRQAPPPRPPARVDASMALLREAAERSLDPSYAAAAAERRDREGAGTALPIAVRRRRAALSGALALLLGLAVVGAVTQLRAPAAPEVRAELLSQIEERSAEATALQEQVAGLRADVDARQDALLGGSSDAAVVRAGEWSVAAATTPVSGPGLSISLDDPVGARDAQRDADGGATAVDATAFVLDRDLLTVVNELWASGAEAIAVNGERITALTAIRRAGDAILVNFTPLSPPYVIEAVGDSSAMAASFRASPAATYLDDLQTRYAIRVSSSAHDDLDLPADGSTALRFATVLPGSTTTAAGSRSAAGTTTTAPPGDATTQEDPSP